MTFHPARLRRWAFAALSMMTAAVGAMWSATTTPATAASEDPTTPLLAASEDSCIVLVAPEAAVDAGSPEVLYIACEPTFPEASAAMAPEAGDDSVVIGKDFTEPSAQGQRIRWWGTAGRCDQNTRYKVSSIRNQLGGDLGDHWNDNIESGGGLHNCYNNRHFEHADFGGNSIRCGNLDADLGWCIGMGDMANETSSLKWRSF